MEAKAMILHSLRLCVGLKEVNAPYSTRQCIWDVDGKIKERKITKNNNNNKILFYYFCYKL